MSRALNLDFKRRGVKIIWGPVVMIGLNLNVFTGVEWFKLDDLVHEFLISISQINRNGIAKAKNRKMITEIIWQNFKNVTRISFFFTFFIINILGLFMYHMLASFSLRYVNRKLFCKVQRFFEALFVRLLLSLIQVIVGNELVLSIPEIDEIRYPNAKLSESKFARVFNGIDCSVLEDSSLSSKSSKTSVSRDLIMCNHQIYSDWIFLWALMDRIDRAGEVKIIMKRSLRQIPIFGWSMRCFDFVFLNRKWEMDQVHFTKKLRGFVESEAPFCLLIFPEGTTLTRKTLAKSESFATKLGVKPTSRVLLPRVLGMWEAVKALDPALDGIFDLTVGYSGLDEMDEPEKVYTLSKLFYSGIAPPQVHYHISYIPRKEIPRQSVDEFGDWLRDRYYEKDRLLDEFYRTGKFPNSRSITKRLCPRYYLVQTIFQTIFCLASIYFWYLVIAELLIPSLYKLIIWIMTSLNK